MTIFVEKNTLSMIFNILSTQLPLTDPVLKFFIILLIILLIPILSERIKIPHLLGMIIAGVVIGPHGLNLLERDSGIILSGTAGLLYIMFLAGLEIDMGDFKKNVGRSILLGLYGFVIPMIIGTLVGVYVLQFSVLTSVLLASMFASHTLITYPIVSKMGITKNRAVNISIGSTLITNTLALLVLAIIVGLTQGDINKLFWLKLTFSFVLFTITILFLFPIIAHWFFKRFSDNVSQYIFVLVIVFLGAVLSQFAGIEPIIGAFMGGLALNKLVPRTSPLMNRIDFVGNAIFIPFFLIGVGMLINYKSFFHLDTIIVAIVMTVVATGAKFLAAWLIQKSFKFSRDERQVIFGLTNSQAAATLAAVIVGYNIILGYTDTGEPIRLLNDNILNGTIIMILVTCTIASFATQKSARNIALSDQDTEEFVESRERILIPVSNPNTIEELVNLSTIIKSKNNWEGVYAVNVINSESPEINAKKKARKILEKAKIAASATDLLLKTFVRFDVNPVNGISNIIMEKNITDLILGLHIKQGLSDSFLGKLTDGILSKNSATTFVYHPSQPISTIKRHIVVVPKDAEYEIGFSFWLAKVWNIGFNTGAKIIFHLHERTSKLINQIQVKHPIEVEFHLHEDLDDIYSIFEGFKSDDNLIFVMSRPNSLSYDPFMEYIPSFVNNHLQNNNFILIYPSQSVAIGKDKVDLIDSSLIKTVESIDVIGKTLASAFRKKQQISERI